MLHRDVAQFGSAHVWGAWSRKFKSCHPDHRRRFFDRLFSFAILRENAQKRLEQWCFGQSHNQVGKTWHNETNTS